MSVLMEKNRWTQSCTCWTMPSCRDARLDAFFASFAQFDLSAPLRLENLGSSNPARRVGIQNGVDDITAAGLPMLVLGSSARNYYKLTRCSDSMGA